MFCNCRTIKNQVFIGDRTSCSQKQQMLYVDDIITLILSSLGVTLISI